MQQVTDILELYFSSVYRFLKAAIINIFILTADHMATCMWKGSLVVMNRPNHAVPLIPAEL